jgi:DNA-binding MarR family transcriptional regulator
MPRAHAESTRAELERRALLGARALVDRMRRLYRDLERLTNAPIAAHRVLACLGEQPGLKASQLASALGMQRPALSQVLKGLVERGWVERVRSESDQRSVRVHLSASGRRVLAATAGRAIGTLQRAVRQLSRAELVGLAVGTEQILWYLREPKSVGTPSSRASLHSVKGRMPAGHSRPAARNRAQARVRG